MIHRPRCGTSGGRFTESGNPLAVRAAMRCRHLPHNDSFSPFLLHPLPEAQISEHPLSYGEHTGRHVGCVGLRLLAGPTPEAEIRPQSVGDRVDLHRIIRLRSRVHLYGNAYDFSVIEQVCQEASFVHEVLSMGSIGGSDEDF